MKFKSPQTHSEYEVVFNADDKFYIAYRKLLETNQYRVRIQCLTEEKIPRLKKVLSNLMYKEKWHDVKNGDHLSVIVKDEKDLVNALTDAAKAILITLTHYNEL